MTVQQILDSIYVIPVILDHLDNPTPLTRTILSEQRISCETIEECREIKHLLKYHHSMIKNDYKPDYELLRQGLKEYFHTYLAKVFVEAKLPLAADILDYGAGTGYMAQRIRQDYPLSKVYTLDRTNSDINVDFETTPDWYKYFKEKFDVVIMSELLHCKNVGWQDYLIESAYAVLKPGGRLLIIENEDYLMAYRISKLKGEAFSIVTQYHINQLTRGLFDQTHFIKIRKHTLYDLTKI